MRRRDAELAAAREAALRSERVVALGNLAAGAAHELGTPLTTMAVLAGELLREPQLPAALRPDLALVQAQIQDCKRIITQLAAQAGTSRAEGLSALPVDEWMTQLIERWRLQRPVIAPGVRLTGPRPGPRIAADATLGQALLNLCNNAADASPDRVEIDARWDARNLEVQVLDRGGGIAGELQQRLGRETIPTRDGGLGVGLMLRGSRGRALRRQPAHRRAPGRGHRCRHASAAGPAAGGARRRLTRMPTDAAAAHFGCLLIVDDDAVLSRVMARALAARGFAVQCADSLDGARAQLAAGLMPDFALLDLNLAGQPGLRLVENLLAANPECEIVVLTGYASITTAVDAIKLGARQYLSKPVDVDAVVKALLEERSPDLDAAPEATLSVSRLEWEHIQRVLLENDNNISATARALKMHRRTLQRKLGKRPAAG